MVYYTEILGRFDFVESDMEYITSIKENMLQYEESFINDVLSYLQNDVLFMSEYGNIIDKLNTNKLSSWYKFRRANCRAIQFYPYMVSK